MESDGELRREVELVGVLRKGPSALAPSPDASARMRARVMAAAAKMMTEHSETGALSPEPGMSGQAEPLRRGQSNVLPMRRVQGRHRTPVITTTAAGAGLRKRGVLALSAAAALLVLAVAGAGTLFSRGEPAGDSLSPVTRTTDTVVGRAPSDGDEHSRSLGADTRSRPLRSSGAGSTAGDNRPADITRSRQSSRPGDPSSRRKTTNGVPRDETGSMPAGLPEVASGSRSEPATGIPGRSRTTDPSGALPNLGLSH